MTGLRNLTLHGKKSDVNIRVDVNFRSKGLYKEWLSKSQCLKLKAAGVTKNTDKNIHKLVLDTKNNYIGWIEYYGL